MLALASGQLMRAMAGGLAVGVAGVVFLHFASLLFALIDRIGAIRWGVCLGVVRSAVALAGGLIAVLAARTKT